MTETPDPEAPDALAVDPGGAAAGPNASLAIPPSLI
ncbi:MAG: hypothetical protein K0R68_4070 [Mycobacterium sp.]|jgi:hypothetical protein|nr:hypothetical protein [Mycobacterium sp.]